MTFIETGNTRETSPEIMAAIDWLARDEADAERIWEEPTPQELLAIWERVTKNGLHESAAFCWGASGSQWAAT